MLAGFGLGTDSDIVQVCDPLGGDVDKGSRRDAELGCEVALLDTVYSFGT
jgi:hypothetical protein